MAIDRGFGIYDTTTTTNDYGYDIKQTIDNGYIVVGYSDNYGFGAKDIFLTKLDQLGDTVWSKIYGTLQDEIGHTVVQTSDGGYAISGHTKGAGAGIEDMFLMKTDANGTMLWSHTYGTAKPDIAYDMVQTSDNGFIIVGETESYKDGWWVNDVFIVKTDANGDTLWTKIYGGESDEIARGVTQTTDGGYAIVGEDGSYSFGMFLMKLDAVGDTSWIKGYRGSSAYPDAFSVNQTADGGFVIGAGAYSAGIGGADILVTKTDGTGVISWSNVYGTVNNDYVATVFESNDGGYYIGGVLNTGGTYLMLGAIKTNSSGTISWSKTYPSQYGNSGYDDRYGMVQCSDNGFALVAEFSNQFGNTPSEAWTGTDVIVVKTDSLGESYGCQQEPLNVSQTAIALTTYNAPFNDSSSTNVSSGIFNEQYSYTSTMHAGARFFMYPSEVTCGGTCDGTIEVNPCNPSGWACGGVVPFSYEWNDPATQSTMTATGLCTGTYIVTVTDAFNCWGIDSVTLSSTAPSQELCIVTVDETSTHNLLSWEKPITTGIDSFKIYRNITGTYTYIGATPYDSLSQFVDTTNGINPNTTSYRYKISTLDTCGNESDMSEFHETIHLTTNIGPTTINLIWDNYEGTMTSFFYYILRDTSGVGNWDVIDSVPETNFTYTDLNPIPNVNNVYMIEVVPPNICVSTKAVNYSSVRSNRPSSMGPSIALNANFSTAATTILEGQSITFNDLSTGSPTNWDWRFDGAIPDSSALENPTSISYATAGQYDVELIVYDGADYDTLLQADYINVLPNNGVAPTADFTASSVSINQGQSVNFTDLSSDSPTSWSWVFTNGSPSASTAQNPQTITYGTAGVYDVTLIASNLNGNDSETKALYITVNSTVTAPVANFSASNTTITEGGALTFTDQSTNAPTSWSWVFSSGTPTTSTAQNPSVQYLTAGTYGVTLTASNSGGGDSEIKAGYITVYSATSAPVTDFAASLTVITEGNAIDFQDISINSPSSWAWVFTGGTPFTSTAQNPQAIVYNTPGTYDVTLTSTNSAGNDALTKTGYITVGVTGIENISLSSNVRVYPNPTKGIIVLEFENHSNNPVLVTVYNSLGQIVISKSYSAKGESTRELNLADFGAGIYNVKINVDTRFTSRRIVVK